jgi:hypothetical protein
MNKFKIRITLAVLVFTLVLGVSSAYGQLTPSGDSYTNTADPTTNYGTKTVLDVESASQTTYIQFNLSSIPAGYTSADITQATLKLYVNAVTTAGSFNVDYVNGAWAEGTIDANNAPALGNTIAASVALTAADKNQYILINITSAVQAWQNGTQPNDGVALVGNSPLNASFDSKESTTTSHSAELDIVFAGGGTLTGVTTASGSGLTGGGTSGTLNLALTNACAANQVLQWNGSSWVCAAVGTGTITGVSGTNGITGGGTSGSVALSLLPNSCAAGNALSGLPFTCSPFATLAANTFTGSQTITGNLALPHTNSAGTQGIISFGGVPFVHDYGPSGSYNSFFGFNAGNLTNTGRFLAAVGDYALSGNTSGQDNTALGYSAGAANTTGSSNTFIGYDANPGTNSLSNATAIGANAVVSQNSSLVLGQTTAGSPGTTWANVGIGTPTPRSILEADAAVAEALGPTITLTNSAGGPNSAASLDFNTYSPSASGTYNPAARIEALDGGNYSDAIVFQSNIPGVANSGLQTNMTILSTGQVNIGAPPPIPGQLVVNQTSEFSTAEGAVVAYGFNAASSGQTGGAGIYAVGGLSKSGGEFWVSQPGGFFTGGEGSGGGGAGGPGVGALGGSGGGDGIAATGSSGGYAGSFQGDVTVTGTLTAATKDFKIDHPLDPANKYLFHASVESSEMKNIYDGTVTTDSQGDATVQLPDWFEAVNTNFRYQLTVIGQFAQAIVSNEVASHQFSIETDKPNVKVSWQITGVRQDAYAKAHPLVVEQEKNVRERGHYIHPELYGASEQQSIEWARNPALMKRIQETEARQLAASQEQSTTTRAEAQPLAVPPGPKNTRPVALPAPLVKPASAQKQAAQPR